MNDVNKTRIWHEFVFFSIFLPGAIVSTYVCIRILFVTSIRGPTGLWKKSPSKSIYYWIISLFQYTSTLFEILINIILNFNIIIILQRFKKSSLNEPILLSSNCSQIWNCRTVFIFNDINSRISVTLRKMLLNYRVMFMVYFSFMTSSKIIGNDIQISLHINIYRYNSSAPKLVMKYGKILYCVLFLAILGCEYAYIYVYNIFSLYYSCDRINIILPKVKCNISEGEFSNMYSNPR